MITKGLKYHKNQYVGAKRSASSLPVYRRHRIPEHPTQKNVFGLDSYSRRYGASSAQILLFYVNLLPTQKTVHFELSLCADAFDFFCLFNVVDVRKTF